jgi:peroxiredoxin
MLERVPPGRVSVAMQVRLSESMYGQTQVQTIDVKAGETAHVKLGGVGRPLVGKFTVPAELAGKMSPANDNTFAMTRVDSLPDFRPANWEQLDEAARQKVREDFLKSPKYLAQRKQLESRRQFSIKVHSDGTFRIEDVPAGEYQLMSVASEPNNKSSFSGEAMATAHANFTVPPMAGDRSDEPLEIGSIEFKAVRRLNVGEVAPELSAKGMDDKAIKLSDFKGKPVLLVFWAAQFGPSNTMELDAVKSVYDHFGKDGSLVVLGLSFDEKIEAAKKVIAEKKLGWPQGFLGAWATSKVVEEWCLRSAPTVILISPEGKVEAKDLRGSGIEKAVKAALKSK